MKKLALSSVLLLLCLQLSRANGICIVHAQQGIYFKLISSEVCTEVNDQIATVTTTQTFYNNSGEDIQIKYGFPMSETGSAISLRWQNNGEWFDADLGAEPQDTTLPGNGGGGGGGGNNSGMAPVIKDYLGASPLFFPLEQVVAAESYLKVELTYVDLLPYAFNKVDFQFPNNYYSLQTAPLESQEFKFTLNSQRTIELVELLSHSGAIVNNDGNTATLELNLSNQPAQDDFFLQYELNAEELGLFSFSTYLPDSAVTCDDHGRGYFAFIVEPDPSENTDVIDKVFTLIIDKSGSMGGDKIVQARNAASFIVNNLNPGDKFNIIAFDNSIISFQPDHVDYNLGTEEDALAFINTLYAGGSTNISGAFSTAIPQFENTNTNVANIILFFTDGEATAGITNTQGILNHVSNLQLVNEVEGLNIFTFGIGDYVNEQLLALLASQNNGLSEFLANEDLETVISEFYLKVRNPVLLNTQMSFDPPAIIESYPVNLPNLFKGQQLIVTGRYQEPVPVNVLFSGLAFGEEVSYEFTFDLADTSVNTLQFMPRLWAKQKMAHLQTEFFTFPENSPQANAIEADIVDISLCHGVISPFTSFEDNTGVTEVDEIDINKTDSRLTASPNPFFEFTKIQLNLKEEIFENTFIEIYDLEGKLLKKLPIQLNGAGDYELEWYGIDENGRVLPPGVYFLKLNVGEAYVLLKVVKI